jgi:hypothetical protein
MEPPACPSRACHSPARARAARPPATPGAARHTAPTTLRTRLAQVRSSSRASLVPAAIHALMLARVAVPQGPGLASLEYVLSRRRFSPGPWLVGEGPTVADIVAFDLVSERLLHV